MITTILQQIHLPLAPGQADSLTGGITNGQEMVAAYIREKFPGPAAEVALEMAGVGDKGIDYTKGKATDTLWWLWQILRAVTVGNGKPKKL